MSHIRLGLYLNIAIAVCLYLWYEKVNKLRASALILLALYFLFCMYALGLASGIANFVILVFVALCYVIYKQPLSLKIPFFVLLFLFLGSVGWYINKVAKQQLEIRTGAQNIPKEKTPWGSTYIHFETKGQVENGNYVLINIELQELRRGWNRRAPGDTFSFQPEHNIKRYEVLVRYLASKGVNKDSLGIAQLSEEDVTNIRRDVFNVDFPKWSFFHRRLYELVNEYDEFKNGRHVNGHSLTMRPLFWQAAWYAIKKHPLIGVGTGDVQYTMNEAYKATNSALNEEWYKRPHNQFITITVALGSIGLLVFILSLVLPAYVLRSDLPKLYWLFFSVLLLSFLMEDTLETQAGQTFFAFFNALFLGQAYHSRSVKIKE